MVKLGFPLIATLFIAGCGGGGGGSDAITHTEQEFSLRLFNDTSPGIVIHTDLRGTDSTGASIVGSFIVTNEPAILMNGVMVTPSIGVLAIAVGSTSIAIEETAFSASDGTLIALYLLPQDILCVPAYPYRLPETVKIGDSEDRPLFTCDNGIELESSWRVDGTGSGLAHIAFNSILRQNGVVIGIGNEIYSIDTSGALFSMFLDSSDPINDYTINLSSL